ncbi:putative coiled-coil domain-containing protein 195 [Rhinophrynus dorsalis]
MEGGTHFMRVIQEMRSEINKLERENKALRGELKQLESKTITAQDIEMRDGNNCSSPRMEEASSKGVLRRNASVGSAHILQEQKGVTMTVRRYSMSSSLLSDSGYHKPSVTMKRHSSSGTLEMNNPAENTEADTTARDPTAQRPSENLRDSNIPKSRSFQEYMHRCRGKVKAVTFLLPMDISTYNENRMTFQGPQNQSPNHLSTIIEKDP